MSVDPGTSGVSVDPGSTFSQALWAAPDLWNTPSLAVTAASSPDPAGTAQGLAHLSQAAAFQSTAAAHTKQSGGSWWSSFTHTVTGGLGDALHVLGTPLRDIQHQYRYLKDVYQRHGFWAGFGETVAALGAGVGATVLTANPLAGMAAAEAVTTAESRAFYHDSWHKSATDKSSPGRDLAGLLGLDGHDGAFKVVSGLTDAAFDLTADPTIIAGKISAARRGMQGFTAARNLRVFGRDIQITARAGAVNNLMQRVAPGLAIDSTDRVDAAYKAYSGYRRAVADIAQRDAAGVVAHYPELQGMAKEFGAATDEAGVHELFRQVANDKEWQARIQTSALPSRSVMRVTAQRVLDKARGDIARQDELPALFGRQNTIDQSRLPDNFDTLSAGAKRKALVAATDSSFQLGAVFRPTITNLQRAVSRKVRTFSGYAPYAVDDVTGAISGEFNLMKDDNLQGVLRSMRFSMGEKTAQKRLQDFIDAKTAAGVADLATRKAIWRETQNEILKAAGLPNDPELVAHLTKVADRTVTGTMHGEAYGNGYSLGDEVNSVQNADGTMRAALYPHQANVMATFPNFRELKSAMRNLGGYKQLYGRVDDIAASRFTNSYFKPLALLTGGFGLRVAASEAIPAAMRYGAWNMLKKRVGVSAQSLGYRLSQNEENPILWAAAKMVGGVDHLINTDESRRLLAIKAVIDGQSHFTYGVASANHNIYGSPDDPTQAMGYGVDQTVKRLAKAKGGDVLWQGSGQFDRFMPEDRNYVDKWQYGLVRRAKETSVQNITGDVRDAITEGMDDPWAYAVGQEAKRIKGIDPATGKNYANGKDPYAYERQMLARHVAQDPDQFAFHRVDDIRNYVTGRDGTLHEALLDKLVAGDNDISLNQLRAIDPASRPRAVAGEVDQPYVGPNVLHNVITTGFDRVVTPIINFISREPLYFQELEKHYNALLPAVKQGVLADEGEAFTFAKTRAMRGILPQVHNTYLRSQLHMTLNNLAPFLFAQEQAYKRVGHLIVREPDAFRKYQLALQSLNNPGFVHTDDQGNKYLMVPFSGEVGAMTQVAMNHLGLPMITGLPLTVQGNLASLKTVLPEVQAPGVSPLAAIPLSHLANLDPMLAGVVKGVVGERGYDEDWLAALVPNTALRSAVRGVLGNEGDRQVANSMMSAIQSAAYHGDLPDPNNKQAMQQFIDRVKNNARSTFFIKAILSTFSPLTPKVDQTDAGLRDEFYKLVKTKGSYAAALQVFLKEHGDSAVSYTVAKTKNLTGANIPPTQAAVDFVLGHRDLLHNHPWGAAFVVPQETGKGGDTQILYNELFRNYLRANATPSDFLNSVYSKLGSQEYFRMRDQHEANLANLTSDPAGTAAEKSAFNVWKETDFRLSNPIAYDYLFGPEKVTNAVQAYSDIVDMFNRGQAPNTPQAQLLYGLLNDYELHRQKLAALGTTRSLGHARQVEKDNWSAYLTQRAKDEPLLTDAIQSVFQRLVQIPEPTGETGD